MKAYYFGCVNRAGHYFWDVNLHKARGTRGVYKPDGLPWEHVDGKLVDEGRPQGEAWLHHKGGWTALAFNDRTVDSRPGSNSAFFFGWEMDFDTTLVTAERVFPVIMERLANAGVEIVDASMQPPPAIRRWRVVGQDSRFVTLAHPMYEYRIAVPLPKPEDPDPSIQRVNPCRTCEWDAACEDGCHS